MRTRTAAQAAGADAGDALVPARPHCSLAIAASRASQCNQEVAKTKRTVTTFLCVPCALLLDGNAHACLGDALYRTQALEGPRTRRTRFPDARAL